MRVYATANAPKTTDTVATVTEKPSARVVVDVVVTTHTCGGVQEPPGPRRETGEANGAEEAAEEHALFPSFFVCFFLFPLSLFFFLSLSVSFCLSHSLSSG